MKEEKKRPTQERIDDIPRSNPHCMKGNYQPTPLFDIFMKCFLWYGSQQEKEEYIKSLNLTDEQNGCIQRLSDSFLSAYHPPLPNYPAGGEHKKGLSIVGENSQEEVYVRRSDIMSLDEDKVRELTSIIRNCLDNFTTKEMVINHYSTHRNSDFVLPTDATKTSFKDTLMNLMNDDKWEGSKSELEQITSELRKKLDIKWLHNHSGVPIGEISKMNKEGKCMCGVPFEVHGTGSCGWDNAATLNE